MTLHRMLRASTALESTPEFEPMTLEPVSGEGVPKLRGRSQAATREKWEWLNGVLVDVAAHQLSSSTFCVAFVIAQHINTRSGDAWPSQKRMMRMTGFSETTLRSHLKALIERRHIQQEKRGVRNGNKYRLFRAPEGSHLT